MSVSSNISIVVVTYQRQELLHVLFDSFKALKTRPEHIIVVDNEKSPRTQQMVETLGQDFSAHYIPMPENAGGAGGFSKGVETAYQLGCEWIWVMDDDVKVFPEAIDTLQKWTNTAVQKNTRAIQPRRKNFDGTDFYWQYDFRHRLGIPNPISPSKFKANETYRKINTACYEGGLFHRSLVEQIGIPDPRFFIYWDDTLYGYLASKVTQPILINDFLMARTRPLDNIRIGETRRLNATSDMARYHIMRNRGYMAHYFKLYQDYNPLIFGFGTFLTLAKETIRLSLSANVKTGFRELLRGMKDAKKIRRDKRWQPMPPIEIKK